MAKSVLEEGAGSIQVCIQLPGREWGKQLKANKVFEQDEE